MCIRDSFLDRLGSTRSCDVLLERNRVISKCRSRQPRSQWLQCQPQRKQFLKVLRRKFLHKGASGRAELYQPLTFQSKQCFTDGDATHPEALGDSGFREQRPWFGGAREYFIPQLRGGLVRAGGYGQLGIHGIDEFRRRFRILKTRATVYRQSWTRARLRAVLCDFTDIPVAKPTAHWPPDPMD